MVFDFAVKRAALLQLGFCVLAAVGCGSTPAAPSMMQSVATGVGPTIPAAGAAAAASSTSGAAAPSSMGSAAAPSSGGAPAPSSTGGAGSSAASSSSSGAAGVMGMGPKANPDGTVVRGTGPATFTRVWEEILMPKGCAGAYCHGSGVGGLKFMKKEEAYGVLVGMMAAGPSCGSSGKMRVKAGDPAASLLLEKISAEKPSCGDAMPIGAKLEPNCVSMNTSVCNTMEDLKLVRDWIMSGAKND